jgi:hypothetical protein
MAWHGVCPEMMVWFSLVVVVSMIDHLDQRGQGNVKRTNPSNPHCFFIPPIVSLRDDEMTINQKYKRTALLWCSGHSILFACLKD